MCTLLCAVSILSRYSKLSLSSGSLFKNSSRGSPASSSGAVLVVVGNAVVVVVEVVVVVVVVDVVVVASSVVVVVVVSISVKETDSLLKSVLGEGLVELTSIGVLAEFIQFNNRMPGLNRAGIRVA